MTQKEFAWELASLESTVARIVLISEAERDLLTALVKIYVCEKDRNGKYAEGNCGIVSVEPSKREIANAIGVTVSTIKRRLKAIRNDAQFITIKGDNWRTHVYDIDFQAIYSAELRDPIPVRNAPPAPVQEKKNSRYRLTNCEQSHSSYEQSSVDNSNGPGPLRVSTGSMDRVQGVQTGGPGGPGGPDSAPYHKTIKDHERPSKLEPIKTMDDGSLTRFSFQDLQKEEFREAASIQTRFPEVVKAGIAKDCDADRLAFFALMIHLARQKNLKNPAGLLTQLLRGEVKTFGKTWRTRATNKDCDQALKMIKELDFGPSDYKRSGDLLTAPEWIDESEFTDEVPLVAQAPDEVTPQLPCDDLAKLQEVFDRKKKEMVKA